MRKISLTISFCVSLCAFSCDAMNQLPMFVSSSSPSGNCSSSGVTSQCLARSSVVVTTSSADTAVFSSNFSNPQVLSGYNNGAYPVDTPSQVVVASYPFFGSSQAEVESTSSNSLSPSIRHRVHCKLPLRLSSSSKQLKFLLTPSPASHKQSKSSLNQQSHKQSKSSLSQQSHKQPKSSLSQQSHKQPKSSLSQQSHKQPKLYLVPQGSLFKQRVVISHKKQPASTR